MKRDDDCPELDQLFAAMQQAPTDPQRVAAERHLQGCPRCQTEWALFQQSESAEVRSHERPAFDFIVKQVQAKRQAEHPGFWRRHLTPSLSPSRLGAGALAIATLVLAIGVTSQWRAHHGRQTLPSQVLNITTPLTGITRPPAGIQWTPVQGAATYTVTLTEVDRARIFYAKVTIPESSLPDSVSELLSQGKTLLLSVTASDSSDREIADSGIVSVRINSN